MAVLGATNLTGCNSIPDFIAGGSRMLFEQSSAPTSWTKQTTHDNKALRVVVGTASPGGSTAFTTVFASRSFTGTVGDTTLSTSEIPSHTHAIEIAVVGPGAEPIGPSITARNPDPVTTTSSGFAGGGGSHGHPFSSGSLDFAVQYVDIIIAAKN
jgi:hypothetical protein